MASDDRKLLLALQLLHYLQSHDGKAWIWNIKQQFTGSELTLPLDFDKFNAASKARDLRHAMMLGPSYEGLSCLAMAVHQVTTGKRTTQDRGANKFITSGCPQVFDFCCRGGKAQLTSCSSQLLQYHYRSATHGASQHSHAGIILR